MVINSLAGGTGSGLGSYANTVLREEFKKVNLINLAVWPLDTGEVIVNSYNTLLSISENYKSVDGIIMVRNQDIYDVCSEIYREKTVNFATINEVIAKQVNSLIMPVYT